MNVLLVFPNVFINLNEPTHFPVGIACVSSYLKSKGHSVFTLNLNFEEGDTKDILEKKIKEDNIRVVETGSLVTHYHFVKEILDCVKEVDGSIVTVLGGGIMTSAPEVIMKGVSSIDFGIIGEGEITNHEFLLELCKPTPNFDNVDGLIYRKSGKLVRTKARKEIGDLSDMPWPDYEGFALDKLLEVAPKRYVTMSTGRSCVYNCTFCFHTSGKIYRQRQLDDFFRELEYLVQKYQIDNIYITDELFASDTQRLYEFCDKIRSCNILWAVQMRVDMVTKELLIKLKESGCIILSLGLESADDRVLKSMNKQTTASQMDAALKCCAEVGITARGAFIFGDINETMETVDTTLAYWNKNREYNIQLNFIQVFPGTALYRYALSKGIITDEPKFIEDGCPYINVSKLTDEEYKNLALKIDEMQSDGAHALADVTVLKRDKKRLRMDVSGKCETCNSLNNLKNIAMAIVTNAKCASCAQAYSINPFELFKSEAKQYLNESLRDSKKTAFWEFAMLLTRCMNCYHRKTRKNHILLILPI